MDAVGIAASQLSVSDKIRALNDLGLPRADIARLLGKRYQHVRNVLEADKALGRPAGLRDGDTPFIHRPEAPAVAEGETLRLDIDADGAIRLPPEVLRGLNLRPGGVATAEIGPGMITILGVEESVRRVQSWVRSLVPADVSLAESLIADRRAEARKD